MARISGVDLPRDKRIEYALPYIYGIGLTLSREILAKTGINPDTRVRDLTEEEVSKIRETLDNDYKVEGDLRREESLNIKRLIEIGSYRGRRPFSAPFIFVKKTAVQTTIIRMPAAIQVTMRAGRFDCRESKP